jgi:hypothetical protein
MLGMISVQGAWMGGLSVGWGYAPWWAGAAWMGAMIILDLALPSGRRVQ